MSKTNTKRGLGRGFDTLIPTQLLDEEFDPTAQEDEQVSQLRNLKIADISADPDQPRRQFDDDALNELAASIKEHGVLQPIVVIAKGSKFEIVAGERRWRAAQIAELDKIPAIVRTLTNQHRLEIALIENLQRQDLNPLETATAYYKLQQQFNLTLDEIGKRVGGKAVSTISNILRLLGLPREAKEALVEGVISEGHARQILAIKEEDIQKELLELIIKNDWSVRKAEQFVVGYKEGKKDKETAVAKVKTETKETEALSQRLGAEVSVKNMAKGGRLVIQFKSQEDFERITGMLLS
ncbi:MAG TPA: ParB/RepB/Spo0J family partition protein [Candidatus Saccharimonadales bacterium]|nr:ParB/RepB/Spo0J family partition protein [Candidatus Saccharimonadales bacterium]